MQYDVIESIGPVQRDKVGDTMATWDLIPGYSKEYAYVASGNGAGKLETITYKDADGTARYVTTYTYDANNNVVSSSTAASE